MRFEIIQEFITNQTRFVESKHFKESDVAFVAMGKTITKTDNEEFAMLYKGVETNYNQSCKSDIVDVAGETLNTSRFCRIAGIFEIMKGELNHRANQKYQEDNNTPSETPNGACGKYYDKLMTARSCGLSVEEQSKIILGIA
jgi:hypothetical protein